jgi:hypothetical protein
MYMLCHKEWIRHLKKVQPLIQTVDVFSRLSYQSVYLIGYFRQAFVLKSRFKVDSVYHLSDFAPSMNIKLAVRFLHRTANCSDDI